MTPTPTEIAREDLCRFIAACYYEPTPAFAEERMFESMLAAARQVDPTLEPVSQRLGEAFAAQDLQTLLIDYTRLFLGPVNPLAQPYASFWLTREKTLMQESTMDVVDLYAEGGFDIDEGFQDLPDHVAAELEFLYLLNHRLHRAAPASSEAGSLNDLRQRFLGDHLGLWIGAFTQAVQDGADTGFYRELGALTRAFMGLEMRGLAAAH
jgi:TorA maturation chaperone TorD